MKIKLHINTKWTWEMCTFIDFFLDQELSNLCCTCWDPNENAKGSVFSYLFIFCIVTFVRFIVDIHTAITIR